MARPTLESLRLRPSIGRGTIMFKEAQMAGPDGGGMPPEMGQSPVTGNPDEMQVPESANHKQYEDDFGSLAYQFVQDRAPALLPYLVGFEIVDRNEDGSKAVGIFGYKVDADFYYVPAFFLNNQVRGVDMVLNKKTNQFVPLTEKWVDFIIDRHAISMGGPADSKVRDTMRNPDLSFVQRPQIGKMASAEDNAPWSFKEAWEHIKEATAKIAETPEFKEAFAGICGQIEKSAESKYIKNFMEKVGGPESMLGFIQAMKDVNFANAALTLYKDAEAFWTNDTRDAAIHVDRMRKIAAARPKVRVVDSVEHLSKAAQDAPASDVGEEDKALSDEENARQILEHDFTIEDSRKDDEVAKVTEDETLVSFETRFNVPDEPGRYNFLMADGSSREGVMLNTVVSPSCAKHMTLFVFDDDDGTVLAEAAPRSLLVTDSPPMTDDADAGDGLKALFDKAKPLSDIEIAGDSKDGTPYLFVDGNGNAAGPFWIAFVTNDGDNTKLYTRYGGDCTVVTDTPAGLEPTYGFMDWNLADRFHGRLGERIARDPDCCCCDGVCGSGNTITVGSFSGLPKKTGSGVIIPHDWKALKLVEIPKRYADYKDGESEQDKRVRDSKAAKEHDEFVAKYQLGSAQTVLEEMSSQGVERIKVASDGTDYYFQVAGAKLQHGPMNYKQASIDLVTRFGLRPRRAFSVLSKVASAGSAKLLVAIPSLAKVEKQAQDNLVGVSMPAPQEQLPAIDPYTGIPVYSSPYIDLVQGQFTGVPGRPPEGGMTHGINIGGEMERNMGGAEIPDEHADSLQGALPIDEEDRRLAEEAAAAGQRHVFDQAAIGGLVKVCDVANVVDSYIPELMDTIDRLGRILFLFYWKHEDFNQRYGSDDVVQMEDRLRNVFKQLGELTLNLKENTIRKE